MGDDWDYLYCEFIGLLWRDCTLFDYFLYDKSIENMRDRILYNLKEMIFDTMSNDRDFEFHIYNSVYLVYLLYFFSFKQPSLNSCFLTFICNQFLLRVNKQNCCNKKLYKQIILYLQ